MGAYESKQQIDVDSYDVECNIPSLLSLSAEGWQISASATIRNQRENVEKQWDHTRVVAVVGLYNKGKTTVVNMLSDQNFTATRVYRTKALAFKLAKGSTHSFIILDSAGLYSPVVLDSKNVKQVQANEGKSEVQLTETNNSEQDKPNDDIGMKFTQTLAEKKATEQFIQELIFKLADVLIVVVNDLTTPDQEYLQSLNHMCSKLSKEENKELFIVHNFKDSTTLTEATKLWKQQVVDIYKSGNEETRKINDEDIRFHTSQIGKHVFLLNKENLEGSLYNEGSIHLLKNWVDSVKVPHIHEREFHALRRIAKYSNEILPKYLSGASEIVLKDNCFKVDSDAKLSMRPWKLDGFTITFGPENIGNYSPLATIGKTSESFKIFIELPGVDKSTIKISLSRTTVVVQGEKGAPFDNNFIKSHLTDECAFGTFERTFNIPEEYDTHHSKVVKSFDKGILTLEFPKSTNFVMSL